MGCAFDTFSTSWIDRSYTLTLFVISWFIPLVIICISYIGIIYGVRHSRIKDLLVKKNCSTCGQSHMCNGMPHLTQRVNYNIIYNLISIYLNLHGLELSIATEYCDKLSHIGLIKTVNKSNKEYKEVYITY